MKRLYFYVRYTTATTVQKLKKDMNSLQERFRVKEVELEASFAEKRDRMSEIEKRLKESLSRFDFFSFYFAPENGYI